MEKAFAEHAQRQQQRRSTQQQQQQQRQQQQQLQAKRDDDDRRQLRQRLERVQAELAAANARAQRAPAAEAEADVDDDAEDSGGYSSWTEEERNKRIELAKGGLAYAAACHGEDSSQAQGFREEILALQRASREAKPFKAHRNQLERKKEELERRQERDESAIAKAKEDISELQGKLDTLQAAVDERARQLKQITEELNEIVRRALEEGRDGEEDEGGKSQDVQAGAPWTALVAAVRGLAGQPGIPQEVAALLGQLQHLASAHAAPSKPAPTTTAPSDVGPKAAAPVTPVVLAPHGRFGKAAAAAKGSPPQPPRSQPTTPSTGTEASGGGAAHGSNGTTGAGAAAAVATSPAGNESEAELVEEAVDGGGAAAMDVDVDIEQSLSKLSEHEQRKIRSAIRGGAGRGQRSSEHGEEAGAGTEEDGRRERERSPRPTKHNDKEL